ncbi:phage baseplate protein, partial [Staphylococcus aureus]
YEMQRSLVGSEMCIRDSGTHNAYRYIDGELWIYSAVLDSNKNNKFVRFQYRTGEITYGNEMQDVMPNIFNDRYTSAIYNPVENLMIFRREYKPTERPVSY